MKIVVEIIQKNRPSKCPPCVHFVKPDGEEGYCNNPKSTWYLQKTTCKCELKETEGW